MPSAGGELSKPWDWRPTDCAAEHNRSASTSWRARTGRAGRARHIGRFVSASVDRAGGDREPAAPPRGAFRKTLVSCSSCARMSTSRLRGHAPSFHQSALLQAAKRGDHRAQEELLRRYEPLIGAILAGLRLPCGCERSDIAQEARIGLVRAIWAWRPERGPFGAFASRCVRDQAINAIDTAGARKHQLLTRAVSLHSIIVRSRRPSDIGETAFESPLHERLSETRPLADPVRTVLAREQIDEIRAALSRLTGKERAALIGDLNGISQQQVASEQGTTEKAVHRSLRRARDKLGTREERLAA